MPHSPLACRFVRTQSGMKLPLASFQFRFVVSARPVTGLAGAVDVPESAFTMYLPTLPFSGGLAVAEHVPRRAEPRGDVLPVHRVLGRRGEVAVGCQRRGADGLRRIVVFQVVEPQPAGQRHVAERPPVLHEQAHLGFEIGAVLVRRGPHLDEVRHAVVEPVGHRLRDVVGADDRVARRVRVAELQGMRAGDVGSGGEVGVHVGCRRAVERGRRRTAAGMTAVHQAGKFPALLEHGDEVARPA